MRDLYQISMKLWQSYRDGQKTAFEQLFHLCYEPLYGFGRSLQADNESIQDAIQEAFFGLWQQEQKKQNIDAVWPYLIRSVRNRILDASRREERKSKYESSLPSAQHQASPEEELLTEESLKATQEQLQQQLDQLPRRQSEAIYWRYYGGLDYPEIADYMGVSQQVAYNYVNRGLKNLRQRVKEAD